MKMKGIKIKAKGLVEIAAKKVTLNTVGRSTPWDFYEPDISERLRSWTDKQNTGK